MQRDETKVDVNPRGRICSKRPRQRNGEITRALLRFVPGTLQPNRYCQPPGMLLWIAQRVFGPYIERGRSMPDIGHS